VGHVVHFGASVCETSTHYLSYSGRTCIDSTKSALGHNMRTYVFMSIGICGSHSAFRCVPGAKCLRTIFQTQVHQYECDKKRVGTSYTKLEFSYPVASAGQLVHSDASGV
jgi:hypothetical protein